MEVGEKNKQTKEKISLKKEIITFCIIPILLVTILDQFFGIYNLGFIWFVSGKTMIISYIILTSMFFLFLGITKNTKRSILILCIIILVFTVINQLKIAYTYEPIVFSDLLFLSSSGELMSIVDNTILGLLAGYIWKTLLLILVLAFVVFLGYKYNFEIKQRKLRIISIIVPIIILTILFLPIPQMKNIILENLYEIDERKDYASITSNIVYYANYGVIGGMYGQLLENRLTEPEGYNDKEIEKALNEVNIADSEKNWGNPNIILVFSESFWDIDQLEEVKFNKKVTSNFNELKNDGIFVNLISPVYGGVSANVEFELLTGANLCYFNRGYIPYMQLYRNNTYYNRPSIINELNNNGYYTKIVSGSTDKLFGCGKIYKYFGMDEAEYLADIKGDAIKGKYISDEYLTSKIINEISNKPKDQKMFYIALTMQAHMPYTIDKYDRYDVEVIKSNLTSEMNDILTSYAQGIYDADKELKRLYDYIQTIDEETIIVFLGDHLPYLKTNKGEDILEKLEYFNTSDILLNNYRKYNTQALILSNYDLGEKESKYLGDDLLITYIINNMDINISNYYKWLYSTKDTMSGVNHYVAMDQDGNLYNTNELDDDMKDIYLLREKIQYKLFVDD